MTAGRTAHAPAMALRTAVILLIFVIVFTGLLAAAYLWTGRRSKPRRRGREDEADQRGAAARLYDNDLLKDSRALRRRRLLGTRRPIDRLSARKGRQPARWSSKPWRPTAMPARSACCLPCRRRQPARRARHAAQGNPGLGDYIEPRKDKNKARPWIRQFDGQSLRRSTDGMAGEEGWRPLRLGRRGDGDAARRHQGRAQGNCSMSPRTGSSCYASK
jgi:electron transport complex protein RnfG